MTVKASFDITTTEGKKMVFNAQNGASVSLKKLNNGDVIECDGVMQYEDTVDSYGKPQEVVITVLFGTDGTSYAGVSDTVAKAGEKLIDFVTQTGMSPFYVKLVKQNSEKGNEFLNLQLV